MATGNISYERLLASRQFQFLVGPEKKSFSLHSAVVSHYSDVLNALISGGMSESVKGCAVLEDVDVQTFVRFSEFAYTGNYMDLSVAVVQKDKKKTVNEKKTVNNGSFVGAPILETTFPSAFHAYAASRNNDLSLPQSGDTAFAKQSVQEHDKRDALWIKFEGGPYKDSSLQVATPLAVASSVFPVTRGEDQTPDFLCHAKVYVFADKYQINALTTLSMKKMTSMLVEFGLSPPKEKIKDIVMLVKYAYDNTPDLDASMDGLRQIIAHYCSCVVEHLTRDEDFLELLEQYSTFSKDLLEFMIKRLDEKNRRHGR